jgi:AcrR family transcriptional regulator
MTSRTRDAPNRIGGQTEAERRLLDSGLTLFSENGYNGTSVRQIIERAGVTRPVLYYYFKSKEDLFLRLVDTSFAEFNAHIDGILSKVSGCGERLKAVMAMAFERTEQSPETVRLISQVFFSASHEKIWPDARQLLGNRLDRIVRIMQGGLKTGELSGGDAETLAFVFAGVMSMHIMAKARMTEAKLTRALAEGLVGIFMDGAGSRGTCPLPVKSPFAGLMNGNEFGVVGKEQLFG